MIYFLGFIGGFLIVGMLVNVVNDRRYKPSGQPKQDLRLAYAPNLIQVLVDQDKYRNEKDREYRQRVKDVEKESWDLYYRQLQDARIKRLLEGNPVTDENPLKGKEIPTPPHNPYARISSPYY